MKSLITAVFIFTLVLVGNGIAQSPPPESKKETVVVEFTDKTKLADVILQGTYVFEHDDSRMARGEACMYVYGYVNGKADKLVVSFHCKPVERVIAKELVMNVEMTRAPDVFALKEIQFAGTTKGHIVP
jgi:hypothetical protein